MTLLALLAGCRPEPGPFETPDPPTVAGTVPLDLPSIPTRGDVDGDGFAAESDCDDGDPTVFPGAPDVCGDDRVTDCRRTTDDGLATVDGLATFVDLQQALDVGGAQVTVCAGTWLGPFAADEGVDLVAHDGPRATVLDGRRLGATLEVAGGAVRGFTITGGTDGGLVLSSPGGLTVEDCVIAGNASDGAGGGIFAPSGSSLEVRSSRILGNSAHAGGGLLVAGQALLVDVEIADNTAEDGGGIRVRGATPYTGATSVEIHGGRIAGNSGGGASLSWAWLASEGTDWGTGEDDNAPSDVSTQDRPYSGYAASESFGCDPEGCTPAP